MDAWQAHQEYMKKRNMRDDTSTSHKKLFFTVVLITLAFLIAAFKVI